MKKLGIWTMVLGLVLGFTATIVAVYIPDQIRAVMSFIAGTLLVSFVAMWVLLGLINPDDKPRTLGVVLITYAAGFFGSSGAMAIWLIESIEPALFITPLSVIGMMFGTALWSTRKLCTPRPPAKVE